MDLLGRVLHQTAVDHGDFGASFMTASLDRDGSCVTFSTAAPEVAADLNRRSDVYRACQG